MQYIQNLLISVLIGLGLYAMLNFLLIKPLSLHEKYYNKFYQGEEKKDKRHILSLLVVGLSATLITVLLALIPGIGTMLAENQNISDGITIGILITGINIVYLEKKEE
ncbi:MAG: hypothetical protein ACOC2J_01940 [bacterium]